MSWALFDAPLDGQLSVVIHGESDCLNCFFHHSGNGGIRFYSTRLTDHQISTGQTQAPLAHLLRLIAQERKPDAVLVLGTCPVEVIGDRFETTVMAVAEETGVPMVALHTHGLAMMPLHTVQDWMGSTLASLPQHDCPARRGINLVGLPAGFDEEVLRGVLNALGTELRGVFPNRVPLSAWQQISHAEHSLFVDSGMFRKLARVLKRGGQSIHDVPMPLGIQGTSDFFREIARHTGFSGSVDDILAPHISPLREPLAAFRSRALGTRVALCVRMMKTHRSDILAYDGLSPYWMLSELGFSVDILVQGPTEEGAVASYVEMVEKRGITGVAVVPFAGPWMLGTVLREGGYQAAVMSDVARNVVEQAGIRWVSTGGLRPFYAGMSSNLALLERLIR